MRFQFFEPSSETPADHVNPSISGPPSRLAPVAVNGRVHFNPRAGLAGSVRLNQLDLNHYVLNVWWLEVKFEFFQPSS
jgi:hypothetical protein